MPATEETYRSQPGLHVAFGVGSILMLATIVWMIAADHLRPWKTVQREFRAIEYDKLKAREAEVKTAEDAANQSALAEIDQKIEAARAVEAQNAREIARQVNLLKTVQGKYEQLDTDRKFKKAELDSQRSLYDGMIERGEMAGARTYMETTVAATEEQLRAITDAYERSKAALAVEQSKLEGLRGNVAELEKEKERLNREVARAEKVATDAGQRYGEGNFVNRAFAWMRDLPLMDVAAPAVKINQISLPELTINYNFKEVPRYDRCTTCHLGIDKLGYEVDAEGKPMPDVFASHPFLTDGATTIDPRGKVVTAGLYLDGNGPHPINKVGCTICHGGQGSGTDFTYASHTPSDLHEEHDWHERLGWHKMHHWDEPMLPTRFVESSCVKCHHEVTDVPQATKLQAGYQRVVKYGCTGCHTIGGEGSIGPDLTDAPKTGPNLRHLASKVSRDWANKWIKNPHAFRPDSRMPRFYEVSNNLAEADRPKVDAEVLAIAEYLFQKSTPPEGFAKPLEPGAQGEGPPARSETDAAAGKNLFLQKGCLACHSHKEYAPDTLPEGARPYAAATHGPNLSNLADKFITDEQGYAWLANWIKAPEKYHPTSLMPNLQLTWADSGNLASWLLSVPAEWPGEVTQPSLDDKATVAGLDDLTRLFQVKAGTPLSQLDSKVGAMSPQEKLLFVGEKTIGRLGCFGCHTIDGYENYKPIGTALNGWGVKSPARLDYAHIVEYLDDRKQPGEEGAEPEYDGTDEYYYEQLADQTRAGFLFQKLHRPRSYDYKKTKEEVKAWDDRLRMPQFHWADDPSAIEEVMTFVLGLTGEKVDSTYLAATHATPAEAAVARGERLLERYNCKACHVLAMPKFTIAAGTKVADAMPEFDTNVNASYGPQGRGGDFLAELYPELAKGYDPAVPPVLSPDDGASAYTIEAMPTQVFEDDDGQPTLQAMQVWRPTTIRGYTFNTGDNLIVNLKNVKVTPADGGDFAWLYANVEAARTGNPFADAWNRLPPPLIREGLKVQTPWLTRFLQDPYPIRPAAQLRMPRFHYVQQAGDTRDLANYFAAADGAPFPYQEVPERTTSYLADKGATHPDYLAAGWTMMSGQGSACIQCHAIGANLPTGGANVVNGPDLRQVGDRFRPDYLREWLARPSRLVPYTAMPQNVPPKGAPAVPMPDSFQGQPFAIVTAMRDTLLNYVNAIEQQLAKSKGPAAAPAAGAEPPKPAAASSGE